VTEDAQRSLGDKLSVDSIQEHTRKAEDTADEHRRVHLRLWRLYCTATQRSNVASKQASK